MLRSLALLLAKSVGHQSMREPFTDRLLADIERLCRRHLTYNKT